MKGLGGKLLGDEQKFPFEQRIFNFAMLLAICMTFFGTVMDVCYRANIAIDLLFLGCWLLTYYLSRFRGRFRLVSVVSIGIFVFAFIPFNWISSGGSGSVLPYYTVIFIAFIGVTLKGRFRIAMVCSILVMELLLIGYDSFLAGSPEATVQYHERFIDLAIFLPVIMASTAVLLIVYSNTYMKEKARSEDYARTIGEHYQQQLYYMENLEQLIYKLKSERHDFNNHLGVLYGLLEGGETDKARRYAMQQVKNAQEYQNIVNISYSMVRAVLNYKLSAARESGIGLRLDVNLPAGLELDEFDLTVILGNLLDNAAEACAMLEEGKRYIGLCIQYNPDYLVIQVENPVKEGAEPPAGQVRTTKPDAENHGFGLKNIEYLMGKHNGFLDIGLKNGVFKANIALLVHMQS